MKKLFIVTGELSGDRLAAWYVGKRKQQDPNLYIEAIGGDALQAVGVVLQQRFETLNLVGILEIIKHIPSILHRMYQLVDYIAQHQFDEVVVVDFPGFNLRLIRLLKKKIGSIKITYLSPPQLWCWGAWRIKKLKKYTDQVIVIYPFEVAWYAQRGVLAQWLGTPVYEMLSHYRSCLPPKKSQIALVPGSRPSEVAALLPIFLQAVYMVKKKYPELQIVLVKAPSIELQIYEALVQQHRLENIWCDICILSSHEEKFATLAQSFVALSKPGTVTLELALLEVPLVIGFATSWISYIIGRLVVNVPYMGLPNLIAGKEIFKEYIQSQCKATLLADELEQIYLGFSQQTAAYQKMVQDAQRIASIVSSP